MKTLIIGLDSATWGKLEYLCKQSEIPNIENLIKNGVRGELESTRPPMTPQAWTTAVTGVNPGKHGIYDFLEQDNRNYSIGPVDYSNMDRPALWDIFNHYDRNVGFLNFPITYPPPSIDNFFLSGIPHSVQEDIVRPQSYNKLLDSKNYKVQPDSNPKRSPSRYLQEVKDLSEIRADISLHLLKDNDFEVFWVVFMGIDWIQHYLWDRDINGENAVDHIYKHMDYLIGRFLHAVDDTWNIVIVSDHGARKIHGEIHINSLLKRWGYLEKDKSEGQLINKLKRQISAKLWEMGKSFPPRVRKLGKQKLGRLKDSLAAAKGTRKFVNRDIDWSETEAFSFGAMGRVFIHDEKRYANGVVSVEKKEDLQEELIKRLENLRHPDTGEMVVDNAIEGSEIYEGPKLEFAPDIVIDPADWRFMMYGDFDESWINEPMGRVADHDPDGILIMNGSAFDSTSISGNLVDLTPTLLMLHQLPILSDMDGKILWDAFSKDIVESMSVQKVSSTEIEQSFGEDNLSQEENVKGRLEDLGYI